MTEDSEMPAAAPKRGHKPIDFSRFSHGRDTWKFAVLDSTGEAPPSSMSPERPDPEVLSPSRTMRIAAPPARPQPGRDILCDWGTAGRPVALAGPPARPKPGRELLWLHFERRQRMADEAQPHIADISSNNKVEKCRLRRQHLQREGNKGRAERRVRAERTVEQRREQLRRDRDQAADAATSKALTASDEAIHRRRGHLHLLTRIARDVRGAPEPPPPALQPRPPLFPPISARRPAPRHQNPVPDASSPVPRMGHIPEEAVAAAREWIQWKKRQEVSVHEVGD